MKLFVFCVLASVSVINCGLVPAVDEPVDAGVASVKQPTDIVLDVSVDEITDLNVIIDKVLQLTSGVAIEPYNFYVGTRFDFSRRMWWDVVAKFASQDLDFEKRLQEDTNKLLELYKDKEVVRNALNDLYTRITQSIRLTESSLCNTMYAAGNESAGFAAFLMNNIEKDYREIKIKLDFKKGTCLADFEKAYWDTVVGTNTCIKDSIVDTEGTFFDWAYFLSDLRKSHAEWLFVDFLKTLSDAEIVAQIDKYYTTAQKYITIFENDALANTKLMRDNVLSCYAGSYKLYRSKDSFGRARVECYV